MGVFTVVEIYWLWDISRRWGPKIQIALLNTILGVLICTISFGVIQAWQTMPAHYVTMMTTIIGAILGASAVILSYSRLGFQIFMFSWIIPGLIFMFGRGERFFSIMGWIVVSGVFAFTLINLMEYAKQRQLFEARHKLAEANSTLLKREAEIDQELIFASHIQLGIFPESRTHIWPYAFQTTILPLGRITGDYCDIIPRNNAIFAIVGDASGHGVPAAMLTMAAKNVFNNVLQENTSTAQAMAMANQELLKMIKTQDFLTAFLLKLYPSGLV
ncbi:MAG: serine/threonine-protein phosphatase, partial [Turneriella sp.]|nr:serine/threonine-protein phosphatase [Turneriella sp.]